MVVRLLCFCLLLKLFCFSWAKCPPFARYCDDCIQSGPVCAWCAVLNPSRRCGTVKELKHSGCPESFVYNPQGSVHILTNVSSMEPSNTKTPLIQPQELSLHLRPGVSQSFNLTITRPIDQPITEVSLVSTYLPAGADLTISTTTGRDPSIVQVNVQATRCPIDQTQNQTGPWFIYFTPRGLSETVKLEITLECQCECTRQREENSSVCNGLGALVCGQCECSSLFSGPQCISIEEFLATTTEEDVNACRAEPGSKICSDRGACMFGSCHCRVSPDLERQFYGRFCECNDFICPHFRGRLCGGHGECKCGQCICHKNWTDEDCSCTLDTTNCMASNQQLCNGRGSCVCGMCKCDEGYMGPKCEDCPTCPGVCQMYGHCAECRAFGTRLTPDRCEKQCGHLTLTMVDTKNDLPEQLCVRQQDDCFMYYHVSNQPSGPNITVARTRLCK